MALHGRHLGWSLADRRRRLGGVVGAPAGTRSGTQIVGVHRRLRLPLQYVNLADVRAWNLVGYILPRDGSASGHLHLLPANRGRNQLAPFELSKHLHHESVLWLDYRGMGGR